MLRTAPRVGVCYTLLVLGYMELGPDASQVGLPIRPWVTPLHRLSWEPHELRLSPARKMAKVESDTLPGASTPYTGSWDERG